VQYEPGLADTVTVKPVLIDETGHPGPSKIYGEKPRPGEDKSTKEKRAKRIKEKAKIERRKDGARDDSLSRGKSWD